MAIATFDEAQFARRSTQASERAAITSQLPQFCTRAEWLRPPARSRRTACSVGRSIRSRLPSRSKQLLRRHQHTAQRLRPRSSCQGRAWAGRTHL